MEYFSMKLRALTSLFSSQVKVEGEGAHKISNVYSENIFKILSWNDPFLSWCSFLAVNVVFWLAVQLELKLFGILFLIILIIFIYDNLFNNGQSPNTQNTYYAEEMEIFRSQINFYISAMLVLRKENPQTFCWLMSSFFLILSYIAKYLSGLLLTYVMILSIFFVPVAYTKLPLQLKNGFKESFNMIISRGIIDENDLIPNENQSKDPDDMDVELESLDTDKTAESVSNSLISGISSMPSFLDAEDNREILEEDLLPIMTSDVRQSSHGLADLSSDSDSEIKDINFRDSHFSRDTSSDEGNKFEEGLHFSEDSVDSNNLQQGTNQLFQNLVGYVASASLKGFQLSNIVNNAVNSMQGTQIQRENSSSESDFEIIDSDDAKH